MNLLTPAQAAERLNVPTATLAQWRFNGKGPQYVKFGARHVRYQPDILDAWIDAQVRTSTSDTGAALTA